LLRVPGPATLEVTVSQPGDRGVSPPGVSLRKVGAPQGRMLASGQSGRPAGKCHREQTADGFGFLRESGHR